jgi:hypothetical protein
MGNKRNLHRMKGSYKNALTIKAKYKKRGDMKKRVRKLKVKTTAEDHSDNEEEKQLKRVPLKLVKVIDEEELIETMDVRAWGKVKEMSYVIRIPESYQKLCEDTHDFYPEEMCVYLKRMREYNSFIADYSKKDVNIALFKHIFQKYDDTVKAMDFGNLQNSIMFLDAYYKNIYEMASALPETFLDYVRNKLSAYTLLIERLSTQGSLPEVFQKDIFFFTRL